MSASNEVASAAHSLQCAEGRMQSKSEGQVQPKEETCPERKENSCPQSQSKYKSDSTVKEQPEGQGEPKGKGKGEPKGKGEKGHSNQEQSSQEKGTQNGLQPCLLQGLPCSHSTWHGSKQGGAPKWYELIIKFETPDVWYQAAKTARKTAAADAVS